MKTMARVRVEILEGAARMGLVGPGWGEGGSVFDQRQTHVVLLTVPSTACGPSLVSYEFIIMVLLLTHVSVSAKFLINERVLSLEIGMD